MKRLSYLVGALVVSLAMLSHAEAKGKKKKDEPAQARVTVITDVSANSISISDRGASKTVALTQFTEILFKGQRAKITDLQPGMAVSVTLANDPTKASRVNASDPPKQN